MKKSAKSEAARKRTEADPRWTKVNARDAASDGAFFYSVASTGVYCKPSCASRPAAAQTTGQSSPANAR